MKAPAPGAGLPTAGEPAWLFGLMSQCDLQTAVPPLEAKKFKFMARIAHRFVKNSFWAIIGSLVVIRRGRKSEEPVFPKDTQIPPLLPFLLGIQFSTCIEHLLCTEHSDHCERD